VLNLSQQETRGIRLHMGENKLWVIEIVGYRTRKEVAEVTEEGEHVKN
jgi:hypothetical protein